uniref:OmpA family protein n=1 Tax=uncultured Tateyamaria sp. TaxID=455651 RepID=UPI0026042DE1
AQAAAEAEAAEQAELAAQAAAEAEAAEQAELAAQAAAEAEAAEQAELAAQAAAEAEAAEIEAELAAEAEADATEESVTTIEEDTTAKTVTAPVEDDATASGLTKAEQKALRKAERQAARKAERQAERRAARQAERLAEADTEVAAAAASSASIAEVETEEVTAATTRSSDEEFTSEPKVAARAEDDDQDDGLSKFEKALLVGLGAVAVGQLLNNGDEVVSNSGDRVVVRGDDGLRVLKSDNELLRRPGADVRTETFSDGSTRTTVTQPDGNRVVTIAAADGRVIQRIVVRPDGTEVVLIDDTTQAAPVDFAFLDTAAPTQRDVNITDEVALRAALQGQLLADPGRSFSLAQVRNLRSVRELAPTIELNAVTFASGSAAIQPNQAEDLVSLGSAIVDVIRTQPEAVFLIEGHTDAVGQDAYNLALSDRRAETVALALTEYFNVPPENLITQGYGESALKVPTLTAERANRRAVVRNITPLLR